MSILQLNPFETPKKLRQLILKNIKLTPRVKLDGKGFICALVNSRCHLGCKHCMFFSNMSERKNSFNTMTPERVNKLMRLAKESNTGYLLISGGGEGFLEPELMYQIARDTPADLTWLVTSAFWAVDKRRAFGIVENLFKNFKVQKGNHRRLCIRVSIDSHHINSAMRYGSNPFLAVSNLVEIFESKYLNESSFFIQLHALEGEEELIDRLCAELKAKKTIGVSDLHYNEKITQSAVVMCRPSGFKFEVTFAKLLLSDLEVDLRDFERVRTSSLIWEQDAYINEKNQVAYQFNANGAIGTDMLVIYDGRVAGGWQSEMPDVSINIDVDSYGEIIEKTFTDPGCLATIENGLSYRFSIIDEVCPKACIRARAVNVRDYTSPILLEEDTVKLYYSIRTIQDYIADNRISKEEIASWPVELKEIILLPKEQLINLYRSSTYDIIEQFKENEEGFEQLWEAIKKFSEQVRVNSQLSFEWKPTSFDFWILDKWRMLFRRILHDWYDLKSLEINLEVLKEVEFFIDNTLLKKRRYYDGLSRWSNLF